MIRHPRCHVTGDLCIESWHEMIRHPSPYDIHDMTPSPHDIWPSNMLFLSRAGPEVAKCPRSCPKLTRFDFPVAPRPVTKGLMHVVCKLSRASPKFYFLGPAPMWPHTEDTMWSRVPQLQAQPWRGKDINTMYSNTTLTGRHYLYEVYKKYLYCS